MAPVHRLLNDLGENKTLYITAISIFIAQINTIYCSSCVILLGMSVADIDEVVLVGGTTRIPRVKQQLRYIPRICLLNILRRELFKKELNDKIDPDITVAYGAASILD